MQKRLLIGAGAAAVVFGGAYGFAATLGLDSDNLGAGSDDVATCDDTNATTSYVTSFASGSYKVSSVIVNLDAACALENVGVTLSGAAGPLGDGQGVADGSGDVTIAIAEDVNAADVTSVDVIAHTGDSTSPED